MRNVTSTQEKKRKAEVFTSVSTQDPKYELDVESGLLPSRKKAKLLNKIKDLEETKEIYVFKRNYAERRKKSKAVAKLTVNIKKIDIDLEHLRTELEEEEKDEIVPLFQQPETIPLEDLTTPSSVLEDIPTAPSSPLGEWPAEFDTDELLRDFGFGREEEKQEKPEPNPYQLCRSQIIVVE